jgi:hypothetical protein
MTIGGLSAKSVRVKPKLLFRTTQTDHTHSSSCPFFHAFRRVPQRRKRGERAAWARETLQIWRTSFRFAQSPAPILSLVLPVFALRFGGIAVPACSNPRTEILACGIPPDSCGSSLPEMDAVDFGWEPGARKFGFRFSASSWVDWSAD